MPDMPAGIRTYLDNAAKASGKSEKDMLAVLSRSGLKTHGDLRSHAMEALGLGHGHANALAAYYLKPEWQTKAPGAGAVKKAAKTAKTTAKKAAKAPLKKAAAKKK